MKLSPAPVLLVLALSGCAGKDPAAARELRITGYPTMVALAQDGREIDRLQGYHGAREFIDWLGKVSIDSETEDSLQARVGSHGWDDYVRRMSRHPGAGISARDEREIARFLEFHAKQEAERPR